MSEQPCIKSEAYGVSAETCGCPKCAAPQSDPLTKEAEASVRLDGDTHCVDDAPQRDQPERSAIDEANSILYPNRTPSSGADARGLAGQIRFPNVQLSELKRHLMEWQWRETPWMLKEVERIAALLESFRAETLEQAAGCKECDDYLNPPAPADPSSKEVMPSGPDATIRFGLRAVTGGAHPVEQHADSPSAAGADAREWAERVDALYREYGQYVNVSRLAALLESFRAETLAHMLELLNGHRLLSGKLGDECSCGKWNANYTDRDRDVWQAWLQHIRALSPDPNWLARQIVEAKIQEWTQAPFHAWPNVGDDPQHPYPAEWVRGILEHRNRRLAALESASTKLGDKGEGK